ncbi:MAG TPA: AAA family ATPase [Sphingopyxis sp.]|nr:AAA family ATPase [Sphingopyxis sp.]
MKLREFRVREFRSIWDSGAIKVDDQTTCLVGKNEAGKTALLTALYRTNPIITADAVFDETYDYPKREVEDYRFEVENTAKATTSSFSQPMTQRRVNTWPIIPRCPMNSRTR